MRALGDVLVVDLGPPVRACREPVGAGTFLAAPGGTSLGVRLLDEALAGVDATFDPLSAANVLVFAVGPFAGTPVPAATKHAVVTISPLTGRVSDGLSSSHWSAALRGLGLAAIVVRGAAPAWSVLVISERGVEVRDARLALGLSAAQTADFLCESVLGAGASDRAKRAVRTAAIGVAGEALVPFATIENDGRQAGRGGAGAVMGSKRLKAIVLLEPSQARAGFDGCADPAAARALASDLRARMLGPATAKYRTTGTGANLRALARMGMLPARNFTTVAFEGAETIAPERARERPDDYREIRSGCAGCPIQCEHMYVRRSTPERAAGSSEYESVWAFGPNCGVDDLDAVLDAIARCDRYGLDTISTGGTIAFAMECAERGLLARDLFGVPLAFGNAAVLAPAVDAIARGAGGGEGGRLLSRGVRALARELGPRAQAFAMHVKGLELPGYEPRALPTYALALSVCTRGACHNRAAAYDVDLRDPERAPLRTEAERARDVVAAEDEAILWDALVLCKFTRHAVGELAPLGAALLAAVYGLEVDARTLAQTTARAWSRKRDLNARLGWQPEDDTLPERAFEALPDGPYAGRRLLRESLARERVRYEELRALPTSLEGR